MQKLIDNIDKLHTTVMGAERIKRNLGLVFDEPVLRCVEAIKTADRIIENGKNWYVYKNGVEITINKYSYTVITAHKLKAKIRMITDADFKALPEFLYNAVFIPEGVKPPPKDIINKPNIYIYIKDFGKQAGDLGVVAELNGLLIGAAWVRIIHAFGHLDNKTPELAISLLQEFRGCGIGTALMKKLFSLLRDNGYKQTSLSVQKDNPAVRFYKRLGYKITAERPDGAGHEDYLMIKEL